MIQIFGSSLLLCPSPPSTCWTMLNDPNFRLVPSPSVRRPSPHVPLLNDVKGSEYSSRLLVSVRSPHRSMLDDPNMRLVPSSLSVHPSPRWTMSNNPSVRLVPSSPSIRRTMSDDPNNQLLPSSPSVRLLSPRPPVGRFRTIQVFNSSLCLCPFVVCPPVRQCQTIRIFGSSLLLRPPPSPRLTGRLVG